MDKLPVDLQYLDEDIKREPDGDIRLMLVETLMLLCNKKADRIFVRGKFFSGEFLALIFELFEYISALY